MNMKTNQPRLATTKALVAALESAGATPDPLAQSQRFSKLSTRQCGVLLTLVEKQPDLAGAIARNPQRVFWASMNRRLEEIQRGVAALMAQQHKPAATDDDEPAKRPYKRSRLVG